MSILGIRFVNLLLFTLSCFLMANIINQVGAFGLTPPESPALPPAPVANTARPWSEREQILNRNLFGAQVVEEKALPDPEPEEKLTKTNLPIRLLGTIASEDQFVASAAVENTQDRVHQVVRVGHALDKFANVVVSRIDRGRLVLQNGAGREELLLDPQAPSTPTVTGSRRGDQSRSRRRGPASAEASIEARLGKRPDRAPSRVQDPIFDDARKLRKEDKSGNTNKKAPSVQRQAAAQQTVPGREHAGEGDLSASNTATSGSNRSSSPAYQGSVGECVRRNWHRCIDRYGEGNCGVWSNVTSVPIGAFGIDLPWCRP